MTECLFFRGAVSGESGPAFAEEGSRAGGDSGGGATCFVFEGVFLGGVEYRVGFGGAQRGDA